VSLKSCVLAFLFATPAFTALPPAPVVDPELGFSISSVGTDWESSPAPPDSESIKVLFRSKSHKDNTQATLTIRAEKMEHGEKDLKDYVRRWSKEYPKFGYNVLAQNPSKLDGRAALVIDLASTTSNKQARQVLVEKDKTVVLLTCLDGKASFETSLDSCNKIMRNFKWK
jgi:hypothetical protein